MPGGSMRQALHDALQQADEVEKQHKKRHREAQRRYRDRAEREVHVLQATIRALDTQRQTLVLSQPGHALAKLQWRDVARALKDDVYEQQGNQHKLRFQIKAKRTLARALVVWVTQLASPHKNLPAPAQAPWHLSALVASGQARRVGGAWIIQHLQHQLPQWIAKSNFPRILDPLAAIRALPYVAVTVSPFGPSVQFSIRKQRVAPYSSDLIYAAYETLQPPKGGRVLEVVDANTRYIQYPKANDEMIEHHMALSTMCHFRCCRERATGQAGRLDVASART
ncbi:hypothetical protein, variant [Saprolegnia diclina VS20]|uniref:Uncharacterized protein n=1 Tax=Saprolegnia diclina (strain VS20) TaxID=1156394 RepID=T0QWJ1_SAPDV|nr:hypothetical protein, variant [Saprolegnia diclina VS20]EQC38390.1 hypothetical protein, variant [Saprolegnia diclina VS20]|eukprot:XP_008607982.1 hypothetical protein, variant [Saprolegnia diclina VS20]